jgi:hypothetical protein
MSENRNLVELIIEPIKQQLPVLGLLFRPKILALKIKNGSVNLPMAVTFFAFCLSIVTVFSYAFGVKSPIPSALNRAFGTEAFDILDVPIVGEAITYTITISYFGLFIIPGDLVLRHSRFETHRRFLLIYYIIFSGFCIFWEGFAIVLESTMHLPVLTRTILIVLCLVSAAHQLKSVARIYDRSIKQVILRSSIAAIPLAAILLLVVIVGVYVMNLTGIQSSLQVSPRMDVVGTQGVSEADRRPAAAAPQVFPRYDYLSKVRIPAAAIDIVNQWSPAPLRNGTHVEDLIRFQPAAILEQLGRDRLSPVGSAGRALYQIDDASIIRLGDRIVGHMAVHLDIGASAASEARHIEASVAKSVGIEDQASAAVKILLDQMVGQMMVDMNVELEYKVLKALAHTSSAPQSPAVAQQDQDADRHAVAHQTDTGRHPPAIAPRPGAAASPMTGQGNRPKRQTPRSGYRQ